jgi:outer membrane protein TolC
VAREARGARIALARWLGDEDADRPLASPPSVDTVPLHRHGLDAQLSEHPEIMALAQREELARAGVEVARSNRHPDWSVELMYSERGIGYSNMVTLQVTVPLEIRRGSRQDQILAAKLAEASQARAEREDMLREHTAQVRALIDEWESARERRDHYRSSILPLAADRTTAVRAAHRGGKATLSEVLLARRAEIDARVKALQIEASAARLWAQLTFLSATAEPIPEVRAAPGTDHGEMP